MWLNCCLTGWPAGGVGPSGRRTDAWGAAESSADCLRLVPERGRTCRGNEATVSQLKLQPQLDQSGLTLLSFRTWENPSLSLRPALPLRPSLRVAAQGWSSTCTPGSQGGGAGTATLQTLRGLRKNSSLVLLPGIFLVRNLHGPWRVWKKKNPWSLCL